MHYLHTESHHITGGQPFARLRVCPEYAGSGCRGREWHEEAAGVRICWGSQLAVELQAGGQAPQWLFKVTTALHTSVLRGTVHVEGALTRLRCNAATRGRCTAGGGRCGHAARQRRLAAGQRQ